jgi:hypothetical protein
MDRFDFAEPTSPKDQPEQRKSGVPGPPQAAPRGSGMVFTAGTIIAKIAPKKAIQFPE